MRPLLLPIEKRSCPTSRTPRLCGAGYQPNRPASAGHPRELAGRGAGGLRLFRAGVPDQATTIQPTRHPLALSAQTALILAKRTGAAGAARASGWRGVPDSDQGASSRRGGGDGHPPPQHLVSRHQPNLRGKLRLPALRQTTAGTGLRGGDRRGVGSQCLPRRALRGDRPAAGTAHPTHRRFFRPGAHRHRAGARTLSDPGRAVRFLLRHRQFPAGGAPGRAGQGGGSRDAGQLALADAGKQFAPQPGTLVRLEGTATAVALRHPDGPPGKPVLRHSVLSHHHHLEQRPGAAGCTWPSTR